MDELFEGWVQDVREDLIEKFHAGTLDIPALVQEYNDNVQDLWDSERAGQNEEDLDGFWSLGNAQTTVEEATRWFEDLVEKEGLK